MFSPPVEQRVIRVYLEEQQHADPSPSAPSCPIMEGFPNIRAMTHCQFPRSRAELGFETICMKGLPCPVGATLSDSYD